MTVSVSSPSPVARPGQARPRGGGVHPWDILPIAIVHLLCLGVIWVGWSWIAIAVAVVLWAVRKFVITAFYHRYFSHRTFKVHRVTQFLAAVAGTMTGQRGPLWWAAHHRDHHRHSDRADDIHSPHQHGFLWSHMGWFLSRDGIELKAQAVPDLTRYPELVWVERLQMVGPLALGGMLFVLGAWLDRVAPALGTSGAQMVIWGFAISTTVLYHTTFTINSLAHTWGTRRFETTDDSRNNLWLALLTFGEGWHNNHHYYPASTRQGFYPGEVDLTYGVLRLMEKLGLAWDFRPVPQRVYQVAERRTDGPAGGGS